MTGESTNLLVIDTSTDQPAVGIMSRAGGVHVSSFLATGRHGRDLVPRIGDLLREANLGSWIWKSSPWGWDLARTRDCESV